MIFKNYTFGENVILKCNLGKQKLKLGYLCVYNDSSFPLLVYYLCFTNQIFFILIREWHYN